MLFYTLYCDHDEQEMLIRELDDHNPFESGGSSTHKLPQTSPLLPKQITRVSATLADKTETLHNRPEWAGLEPDGQSGG